MEIPITMEQATAPVPTASVTAEEPPPLYDIKSAY